MQLPVQIKFHNMDPSPAVGEAIRKRAVRLDRFFDRLLDCRVVVEAPHKHRHKGKLYAVRIFLTVPTGELAVTHSGPQNRAHADVYVAARDAFAAARRVLEDYARKLRGDVKSRNKPGTDSAG